MQTVDGTRLGYLDNKTGETVLEDEAHRHAFRAALSAHDGGVATGSCSALVIPAQPTAATALAPPQAPAAAPVAADAPRDTVESVSALVESALWTARRRQHPTAGTGPGAHARGFTGVGVDGPIWPGRGPEPPRVSRHSH